MLARRSAEPRSKSVDWYESTSFRSCRSGPAEATENTRRRSHWRPFFQAIHSVRLLGTRPGPTCREFARTGLPSQSAFNSKRDSEEPDQLKPPSAFPSNSSATSKNPRQAKTWPGLNRSTGIEAVFIRQPPARIRPCRSRARLVGLRHAAAIPTRPAPTVPSTAEGGRSAVQLLGHALRVSTAARPHTH